MKYFSSQYIADAQIEFVSRSLTMLKRKVGIKEYFSHLM